MRYYDSGGSHIVSRAHALLEMLIIQSGCSRFSSDLFSTAEAQAYILTLLTLTMRRCDVCHDGLMCGVFYVFMLHVFTSFLCQHLLYDIIMIIN